MVQLSPPDHARRGPADFFPRKNEAKINFLNKNEPQTRELKPCRPLRLHFYEVFFAAARGPPHLHFYEVSWPITVSTRKNAVENCPFLTVRGGPDPGRPQMAPGGGPRRPQALRTCIFTRFPGQPALFTRKNAVRAPPRRPQALPTCIFTRFLCRQRLSLVKMRPDDPK